jgi:polysaccharide biosynthesis PFTS motif protein
VPGAIPSLTSIASQARFLGWSVVAVAIATADLFRGRWWHALLLSQASTATTVRLLPAGDLARDYLFHMAAHIYRPLWTYEAERRGARVILYNYSTNIETFKRADGYPTQANSWQVTTWPRCLVWDQGQAEFFARMTGGRTTIQVVGPIWFSTSPLMLGAVPTLAVAVFDVQPHRASWYQLLGMGDEFYTPSTVNQFLLDAHRAVGEAGATMILKRKRDIGRQQHPSYAAVGRRLEKAGHFLAVDPSIAATKVIAESRAVISLPFTSTALLGRAMGKPSVYYDPLGTVQRDDRAAHGVPVVIGYEELARWVAANV